MLKEAISNMPTAFDEKILLRGQEYFLKGQVLNIRLSEGLLKGRVKGSSSQIYDVHMDLKTWPKKPSHCSCAYYQNCKHAAACLFALRDREQLGSSKATKLDRKLDTWLKNLRAQEAVITQKQEVTHELRYLLTLDLVGYEHSVIINLALVKILKRGGYGKPAIINTLSDSKKQHFLPEDDEIVSQLLFKCEAYDWFRDLSIRNSELLERVIATGRAYFVAHQQPLRKGETLMGECRWLLAPNGKQRLMLMQNEHIIDPLLLDESWYFDSEQDTLGRLISSYPVKQLRHLLDAPPISLSQARLLSQKMAKNFSEFPTPQVFEQRELCEIKPQPILRLDILGKENDDLWFDREEPYQFIAKVAFDYDGLVISAHDESPHLVRLQGQTLLEYPRDLPFEAVKISEVKEFISLRSLTEWEQRFWDLDPRTLFILKDINFVVDLAELYAKAIPALKERGWRIDYLDPVFQEIVHADEVEWYSDLNETTTDFFSYQLGILVEDKPVNIVPLVVNLLQKYSSQELERVANEEIVQLTLPDGRALQLPMERIKPLIRLLLQFGTRSIDEQNQLKINKYQLIIMQEAELALVATKARWQGAESLRRALNQLVNLTQLPEISPSANLQASLRDYQLYGLSWLQFLRTSRFNGVLADDMGLGKTIQTLAHLQYEKEHGRIKSAVLIIAPTSLVGNWLAEAKRFTPNLSVLIYHGVDRHEDNFDEYDIVISTYGLIHRDKEKFIAYSFYYLILDEAQFIKNARTKTTQIIQQLKAEHRLCLTGTPLENHLGELWSLFHFLMPGLLGDARQFKTWFRTPIEKHSDFARHNLLASRIKPFMLRRTKNQVAKELPAKIEMTQIIEITGAQRDLYEAIRMSMEKKVRDAIAKQGFGKSHIVLLDALLKLRQVCCDPRLLSLPEAVIAHGTSAKLDALMELLDNLMEEGRRVIVFSQFTSMLKLIEEQLKLKQYHYLQLTGKTLNRQALVDSFQAGAAPIFLISLKAGGTGLNLTMADTVIHYDPWWNPAVEDQATDRAHRIGQDSSVFVYKLITGGTVEEVILAMQDRKRQLVTSITAETAQMKSWEEKDLEQFFSPLE